MKKFGRIVHEAGKYAAAVYIALLFLVMPFYAPYGYNLMGAGKWQFFKAISYGLHAGNVYIPGMLMILAFIAIADICINKKQDQISKSDLAILIFAGTVITSALIAVHTYFVPDLSQAVTGVSGWYMGAGAQLGFVLIYFLLEKYWEEQPAGMILAAAASSCVFFFAVLNRFSIDLFGFMKTIPVESQIQNVSTMGNVNWYACYLALHLPLSAYGYLHTQKKQLKIYFGICFLIACMTSVTQGSDSLFLALGMMFLILFFKEGRTNETAEKVNQLFLILFSSMAFTGILQRIFSTHAVIASDLSGICTLSPFSWIGMACCLLFHIFHQKKKLTLPVVRKTAAVLLVFLSLLLMVYIILNSLNLLPDSLQTDGYLRISDSWGNNRGIIWRQGFNAWISMGKDHPYVFLFGAGPDQYSRMVYQYQYYEFVQLGKGVYVTCAHNEFLNILCNCGVIGLASWVCFWFFLLRVSNTIHWQSDMLKCMILAYLVNSVVSIQNIEAAPLLFACAGMLGSYKANRSTYVEK